MATPRWGGQEMSAKSGTGTPRKGDWDPQKGGMGPPERGTGTPPETPPRASRHPWNAVGTPRKGTGTTTDPQKGNLDPPGTPRKGTGSPRDPALCTTRIPERHIPVHPQNPSETHSCAPPEIRLGPPPMSHIMNLSSAQCKRKLTGELHGLSYPPSGFQPSLPLSEK